MQYTAAQDKDDEMTQEITVTEVDQQGVILDVREPHEWTAGHIPGAIHIPLGEVTQRHEELPAGPVQVICLAGGRSLRAADWLNENGREAINVAGGMKAWAQAGLPMTAEGDADPEVV